MSDKTPDANSISFGKQAAAYAKGRPGYPLELYKWIAENSPDQKLVWDVGTGSGQAARSLTRHFSHVHATDISAEQIAAAPKHPHIEYHIAPAHISGLGKGAAHAITVATAVHWFANAKFWVEVERVAAKDALFCAWTYQLPRSTAEVHTAFLDPIYALIEPYWADGNRICMAGYTAENLNCPFPILETPAFDLEDQWSAQRLVDFAQSWSATFRAREDGHTGQIEALTTSFLESFQNKDIPVQMPISVLAARIAP